MNKLHILENLGFKITWRLMQIGVKGSREIPAILSRAEILEYLGDLLNNIDNQTDHIISLICEDNPIEFNTMLEKFAESDGCDISIQKRKWRAYLLKTLLDNLSRDPLQGLLDLMEFWLAMGKPDYCPHVFPTDETVKKDYFTEATYDLLVKKNQDWLDEEISEIIRSE